MENIELVKIRLKYFKCEVKEEDRDILEYLLQKSLNSINNKTNQKYTLETIPNPLRDILIDKTVGEYLFMQKTTDSLSEYDFSLIEKQIQTGDTTVVYNVDGISSPDKKLDTMINYLMNGRDNELVRYRRLSW